MSVTAQAKGDKAIIVGLGMTGLSCARYLAWRGPPFAVADSRAEPPALQELLAMMPDADLRLGDFRDESFADAAELILSPGVDPRLPALRRCRARGVPVTGDIDLFAREISTPMVAVTGSNAKSTVVTLLGEMAAEAGLDAAVAGNIGTPVLDLLREGRVPKDLIILELSSFQLETTTGLGAEVACVLNMSADHMDRYDSMRDYHAAKHRVFQGARQAVINRDDPLSRPLLPAAVKLWSFGLSPPDLGQFGLLEKAGEEYLAQGREALMPVTDLKIVGRHNVANALAALAIGRAAGLDFSPMCGALRNFAGLPHRCQWVGEHRGVHYYNDSKGTNVGACVAALEGLAPKGPLILLAGGVGKGADFSGLAAPAGRHCKLAVLFGEAAGGIAAALQGQVPVERASSLPEAVALAAGRAEPGDLVLLSPACASFDMFRDYRHRGEVFTQSVKELQAA